MPAPRGIHSPHWTCKRLFTVWRHLCSYVHILISLGKTPPSSQAPALTEEEIGARKAIAQLVIRRGPEFSLPGVGKCAPGLLPWVWDAHRAPTGLQAGTVGGLGGGSVPWGAREEAPSGQPTEQAGRAQWSRPGQRGVSRSPLLDGSVPSGRRGRGGLPSGDGLTQPCFPRDTARAGPRPPVRRHPGVGCCSEGLRGQASRSELPRPEAGGTGFHAPCVCSSLAQAPGAREDQHRRRPP